MDVPPITVPLQRMMIDLFSLRRANYHGDLFHETPEGKALKDKHRHGSVPESEFPKECNAGYWAMDAKEAVLTSRLGEFEQFYWELNHNGPPGAVAIPDG